MTLAFRCLAMHRRAWINLGLLVAAAAVLESPAVALRLDAIVYAGMALCLAGRELYGEDWA